MKAAVYRGVNQIRCEEVPVPAVGPDEALIRVVACGLCQSDIKKFLYPLYEPPRIFGHETAGTIEEVGPGVEGWAPGDRVVVLHHIPCLHCAHCLAECYSMCRVFKEVTTTAGFVPSGGGYAQFVKAPGHIVRHGIIPIPEHVSFEEATFVEPVNCCLKAVKKAEVRAGQRALVIGAGPIGLLFVQLLKYYGAVPIVSELMSARREKALELGAEAALDPRDGDAGRALATITNGLGPDVVFLAVPNEQAVQFAFGKVRKGGRIMFFAEFPDEAELPLNPNFLYRNEVSLLGSYSSSYKILELSAEIVMQRRIDVRPLVATEFPLERISEAVQLAVNPDETTLKIVIRP